MELSKQIKAARKRLKLSQSQAVTAWGVGLKALQSWEQGVASPGGKNLLKLIRLGVIKPS